SQTRSFCYVEDLVEGIFRLLFSDDTQPKNIGNPDEITIQHFAEDIIRLTQTTQKVIYKDLPIDDAKQRRPDISKARSNLGSEPKVNRADGVKNTYDYFKSFPEKKITHKDFTYYNK